MIRTVSLAALLLTSAASSALASDPIKIGFAVAQSGWMQAYDEPSFKGAMMAIDELNERGGILGRKIETLVQDTRTDRAEAARVGQDLVDAGVDLMVVSCDYDMGGPAALVAEAAGVISFFLCAEDIKAGVQGIGPHSFSAAAVANVQGQIMAEWGYEKKGFRKAYKLLDTVIQYSRGVCSGFEWQFKQMEGTEIVGEDTFKNDDTSIAAQITRIKNVEEQPDVLVLCSFLPGGASALRQIRAAGIDIPIVAGHALDGEDWLPSVPGLTNFFIPVDGSVYGDDPRPEINEFLERYHAKYGVPPVSQPVFAGYILIEQYEKAVTRAGTTDSQAVLAEYHKFDGEPTLVGGRSYTPDVHIQLVAPSVIVEANDGNYRAVDFWTNSQPMPLEELLAQ